LNEGFPVNVLKAVAAVPEVCTLFCATANQVEIVIAETNLGRGVLGVIDGERPLGIETAADVTERMGLLRALGYKLGGT